MKHRNGFVSNSSSTMFLITNKSNKKKTLVDFVAENPQLLDEYIKEFSWNKGRVCQAHLLFSAKERNMTFKPGETRRCRFGDEDGTVIGRVYDYALRFKIGEDRRKARHSKNFKWKFLESLR